MKKLCIVFFLVFCSFNYDMAEQFLYPVCELDSGKMLVIYQKDVDDLELWLCGEQNHVSVKLLSSLFIPSHVQVIPGGSGFSFLDRGRIRLKDFGKRAPMTVDIAEPIDSILSMSWIDENSFYFTGRSGGRFATFLCNVSNAHCPEVFRLIGGSRRDYLYPCKVGDQLFCIAKNKLENYFILNVRWKPEVYEEDFFVESEDIMFESDEPICFLHMNDSGLGYFLQYKVDKNDEIIQFSCCSVRRTDEVWRVESLFSFQLPSQYLVGSSMKRLYESASPFLPNYSNPLKIYYVDYESSQDCCCIKEFNLLSKEVSVVDIVRKKSFDFHGCFAPKAFGNKLYCGLISNQYFTKTVVNVHEETGLVECHLPCIDLRNNEI